MFSFLNFINNSMTHHHTLSTWNEGVWKIKKKITELKVNHFYIHIIPQTWKCETGTWIPLLDIKKEKIRLFTRLINFSTSIEIHSSRIEKNPWAFSFNFN